MKTGSCLCGEVTLSFTKFERPFIACHCKQCRKQTGTYVTAGHVLDAELTVNGAQHLTWYEASDIAKRGFCRHCGSLLLWKKHKTDYTSIMAGCIDGSTDMPLGLHIYTDDKGDYYDINDDVPKATGSSQTS